MGISTFSSVDLWAGANERLAKVRLQSGAGVPPGAWALAILGLVTVIGAQREFCSGFRGSGGNLDTDRVQERIQIIRDALVQAVELAAPFFGQGAVAAKWRQQSCRERW